jgi:methyltransferase-like protein/SAM-dependent methyltransferase
MIDGKTQYSYDETPYPSYSFAYTHPDCLATLATLLGMKPAPVEQCRVLELGCASGGNLIPMAFSLPGSRFVGIDLSARQIAEGRATITALGLQNASLKHMDLLDVDRSFGQFDYIIAHGVFSWVPVEVQEKLLDICHENLAPAGVAYVSYNTYPGWRMLGTVRDMMLYHTRHLTDPGERVVEARALLDFLAKAAPAKDSPHVTFLNAYLNYVNEYFIPKSDEFLLHDELETVNEPLYFYQFAERAASHGLQYLTEVTFQEMLADNLPAEVSQRLRHMARSTVELEQYMDFLRNRIFRRTLLCHQGTRLGLQLSPEHLSRFYLASSARPEADQPDIHSVSVEKFRADGGSALAIDHPLTKAAMVSLAQVWPQAISFERLLAAARARLNGATFPAATSPNAANEARVLGANLLRAFSHSSDLIELHVYAPQFVLEPGPRPVASPVARLQARSNAQVTNLRHERVDLAKTGHFRILPYLDGSRDRVALLEILETLVADGLIEASPDAKATTSARPEPGNRAALLDSILRELAQVALLTG